MDWLTYAPYAVVAAAGSFALLAPILVIAAVISALRAGEAFREIGLFALVAVAATVPTAFMLGCLTWAGMAVLAEQYLGLSVGVVGVLIGFGFLWLLRDTGDTEETTGDLLVDTVLESASGQMAAPIEAAAS